MRISAVALILLVLTIVLVRDDVSFAASVQSSIRVIVPGGKAAGTVSIHMGHWLSGQRMRLQVRVPWEAFRAEDPSNPDKAGEAVMVAGECSLVGVEVEIMVSLDEPDWARRYLTLSGIALTIESERLPNASGILQCDNIALIDRTTRQKVLNLQMLAEVRVPPSWQDCCGRKISGLNFHFAATNSGSGLDSGRHDVKLMDAAIDPATVKYTGPRDCKVGVSSLADDELQILVNGQSFVSESFVEMKTNELVALRLRLLLAGDSRERKVGAVSCSSPGALTYTF